ncbi:MAG: hypothetical protein WCO29_14280 [Nostocales cyanobacterium ELA583]|jgi:CHAT domain-containing protein
MVILAPTLSDTHTNSVILHNISWNTFERILLETGGDRQYQKYAKISIALDKIQKSKGEFSFAHPRYWSAFTAQGLK